MRQILPLLLAAALVSLAGCHSRGGYFESDPPLARGPGCPDCPSRDRWPAYFGTAGDVPEAGSPDAAGADAAPRTPSAVEPPRNDVERARVPVSARDRPGAPPRPGAPLAAPVRPRSITGVDVVRGTGASGK